MTASNEGIELVKRHESLRLNAYYDPVGIPTIGFGHTKDVKIGDRITAGQAEQFLREDLAAAETEVNRHELGINQNQFDALVSFTFNVGAGAFRTSTLLKRIKENPNDPDIEKQFKRWIYASGKPLRGLINRRNDEAKLYFS